MITGYNFHIQGKRHKAKNTVCQDYSIMHSITPVWKVVAVADGVSSSAKSEIASKMACEVVCEFIEKAFPYDGFNSEFLEQDIEAVIRSAMHAAANAIEAYADELSLPHLDFDTTLVVALYNGKSAYLGIVGDSGIVLLMDDGELRFSTPMNDAAGHVFPLRFRKAYQTASVDDVAAVFCTTDGLYKDAFWQSGEYNKAIVDQFIPYAAFSCDDETVEDFINVFKEKTIEVCEASKGLTDDISISLLINTEKYIEKPQRKEVDILKQLLATVAVYDASVQRRAFKKNILAYYPQLTDEDVDALFDGETDLESVLKKASDATANEETPEQNDEKYEATEKTENSNENDELENESSAEDVEEAEETEEVFSEDDKKTSFLGKVSEFITKNKK